MTRVEIKNGLIGYDKDNILFDDFNIKILDKEFVTILGRTGVGKTTILRIISGLEKLKEGELIVNGDISLCFQDSRLFPNMNVYENIAYPLKIKKYKKEDIEKEVSSIINYLNIDYIKDRNVDTLSGGEIKRVALARCIITKPKILLLDEPTSNLDFEVKIEVREIIKKLHKKYKFTTIMVTHDIFDSIYLSDKVLIVGKNRIITYVDTKNIKKDKATVKYFKPFVEEVEELRKKLK